MPRALLPRIFSICLIVLWLVEGVAIAQQQGQAPKPAPSNSQQNSSGYNSPNIVGNGNKIVVNPPSKPPAPSFHENPEPEFFYFSLGGLFAMGEPIKSIRKKPFNFVASDDYIVASVALKGDKLLFSFTPWSGDGKPVIEVHDNEFTTRIPPGWDRNSSTNALEVINDVGAPVFQMIRMNQTTIQVNGIFPLPKGGFLLAGNGALINTPNVDEARAFRLRPLFKYPSWKYAGEYVDK